ncbi:MAG: PAS domain S-box protein [Thermodesulfobacteriota bacterium]|nr:PAS domain S-box protein [Thermodesulfobacteriota bacterium]
MKPKLVEKSPDDGQRYRKIFDAAVDSMVIVDVNGTIIDANNAYCRMYGYSLNELKGKQIRDLIHPDHSTIFTECLREVDLSGRAKKTEIMDVRKDGRTFPIDIYAVRIHYEGGPFYLGIVRDITERRQADVALRESEKHYRAILETIEEGYWESDLDGNLTFFNDSMSRILGYSREELLGMVYKQVTDEENAEILAQALGRGFNTGRPSRGIEYEVVRKDGKKRYLESSVSPIRDSGGQPVGFRGVLRDVTEKKLIGRDLIETKNFLQSIFDSSIDGVSTTDLDGNIIFCSLKMLEMLGYDREDIIGKKVHQFYGEGIDEARAIMKELRERRELREHEMQLLRKDGSTIDINLSASFLKDEKGEVVGTLGMFRDITDRKTLEAQFRQAQKMESLGTLAGGIAHDFNNLLMGILGNASIMLLDIDSEHPHYERLKSIEQHVQNGAGLTRQLLGFARAGRYEVRPADLNDIIQKSSAMFARTKKEIRIHSKYQEGIWSVEVDHGQIEQALVNLYVNAWQAMRGGGDLYLETDNTWLDEAFVEPYNVEPGRYVNLTVTDTGVGMDEATKQRIFDPFFTTKEMGRGTGLGLASVYGIIKNHGGIIVVHSKKGLGSTFNIYLPVSEKAVVGKKEFEKEILKGSETILLVDDEDLILDIGQEILQTLGYNVLTARGGKKALEMVSKGHIPFPDLIILDMIMPGMGGGEVYNRMKEINPGAKVLLSSGYSIDDRATEILNRGCNGFIQKPFSVEQLSQYIREILDREQ